MYLFFEKFINFVGMSLIENYFLYNFNALIISKYFVNFLGSFPKIKKLVFYFIINIKQYKKNLLLFYIMLSLIFGGILILKRKEIQGLQIFIIELKKKKIYFFLITFISFYLPLLNVVDNTIKKAFVLVKSKKEFFNLYRLNYFSFPVITELDVIYLDYEMIYDFINSYRFQIDVYMKMMLFSKDSGELFLRYYRVPINLKKYKKIL
jgi:hypothetical protein